MDPLLFKKGSAVATAPPRTALPRHVVRLADARLRDEIAVDLAPPADERAAIAATLGLDGLRKLRLVGRLVPEGRHDWRLEAELGATVVQPCVVTMDPVTTRIDEAVLRRYVEGLSYPDGSEVEMPQDDSVEPLPAAVDLAQVMIEALSLALPAWPRAPGVPPADALAAPAGAVPLTDEAVRPFAGLGALRDRLTADDPHSRDDEDDA